MEQSPEAEPVYKLFHWKYQCKIPESMVYSDAVLEDFGTFVSGDEGRDVSNAKLLVGAIRTIAQLATIHGKGFKIELPDNKKAYEIYKIICDHLKACIEFQKNGLWGKLPPVKDLETLEKFAAYIFKQARWHYVGEPDESSTLMTFLAKRSRGTPNEKEAPETHKTITNSILTGRLTGSRAWK